MCSEAIHAKVDIKNNKETTLTGLVCRLKLSDYLLDVKKVSQGTPFAIGAYGSKSTELQLNIGTQKDGKYLLELEILDGATVLCSASKYIHITSGGIVDFEMPDEVNSGDSINFRVLFENKQNLAVQANARIHLYNEAGVKIAILASNFDTVAADSSAWFEVPWDTAGHQAGSYTAAAIVETYTREYGPKSGVFTLISPQEPVDNLVTMTSQDLRYDRRTGQSSVDVTVTNISAESIISPLWLIIESITPSSVTPNNPDGTTTEGKFYFDLSDLLSDGVLSSGENVSRRIYFANPNRERFRAELSVYGIVEGKSGATAAAIPTTAVGDLPRADINGDDRIDLVDFSLLAASWLQSDCRHLDWCGGADLDQNSRVDLNDLSLFLNYYRLGE